MEKELSLKEQKEFIELFINSIMDDKFSFVDIEENLIKMNSLIEERGIIVTYYLLTENFFDAIIKLFFEDNLNELVQKVVKNIFESFNVNMLCSSPTYYFQQKIKEYGIFIELNETRKERTEIEILFDKISCLKSNWEVLRQITFEEDKNDMEDTEMNYYTNLRETFIDCINNMNDLKNNNNKSYVLEFFHELIMNIENFRKVKFNDVINIDGNNQNKILTYNNPIPNNLIKNSNKKKHNDVHLNSEIKKIELKKRTFFYLNEKLKYGEDLETEFKQYGIPFTKFQIDELKKQMCAMLNSKGGRIYIGITDEKIVKGVYLNYKKKDMVRNDLINYTYDFFPQCRRNKIDIYFIPIKNMKNNKFQNDFYVIKIIVHQGDTDKLYSITNKCYISFLRLPGQCANLTASEIYEEISQRKLNPKISVNDDEFKDPEPEENLAESISFHSEENKKNVVKNEFNVNQRKAKNFANNLFVVKVKGIGNEITGKELDEIFQVNCVTKKFFVNNNGFSRGYGYLNFSNINDAQNAIDKFDNTRYKHSIFKLAFKNGK